MGVSIDEPGQNGAAAKIVPDGRRTSQRGDLGIGAHCKEPSVANRNSLGDGEAGVGGEENGIRGLTNDGRRSGQEKDQTHQDQCSVRGCATQKSEDFGNHRNHKIA